MALSAKIYLDKIDHQHVFKGKNGPILDVMLFETPNDKYGNTHMVVQSLPKELRDAGQRGAILGNAKQIGQGGGGQQAQRRSPAPKNKETDTDGPPF